MVPNTFTGGSYHVLRVSGIKYKSLLITVQGTVTCNMCILVTCLQTSHAVLSFLSSRPIPVLFILDTEANMFYDRNHQMYDAALLTRRETQQALRPLIDSEIIHKRHFIKIHFINKGIDLIDLPSIFQDKFVKSSDYFKNSETPIILYLQV